MALRYHIGTSGWHYDHWWHRFYPEELAKAEMYIYFNNDAEAFAVRNAITLRGYLQNAS